MIGGILLLSMMVTVPAVDTSDTATSWQVTEERFRYHDWLYRQCWAQEAMWGLMTRDCEDTEYEPYDYDRPRDNDEQYRLPWDLLR